MKTYEERKKETCEWCAKGGGYAHDRRHLDYDGYLSSQSKPCTALSREDYEAELRAEITRLRAVCAEALPDLRIAFNSIATVIQGAYLNGQLPPISDAELAEKIITEYGHKQASAYEQGKRADASEAKLQYALKIGTSAETRIVERRFSLQDRVSAVISAVHAHDYIVTQKDSYFVDRVNSRTLLRDGIANAIDGRSTGREHATVRHSYRNERDGPHPPTVADADRRCQRCGAVNPPYFQHCWEHMPPRVLVDADPTTPDALTGCASVQSPDIVEAEEPPYRLILEVSRDKLLEAQRHTGLNYSDLIARIDMVLADASPHKDFIAGQPEG